MNLNDVTITDILDVITVFSKKGRSETITNRYCYGLTFTSDGKITYTQNGISYQQDVNYAVILPKNQNYTIHGDIEGSFPVINFETAEFLTDTITVLPIENTDYIYREFNRMKNLFLTQNNRLIVFSVFYNILATLSHTNNYSSANLIPAVKYIENNYHKDITNADLAYKCNLSEEYFRKLFKTAYGISPKQYVTNMRISKAKQLLQEGNLKINAISELCGFTNQYHFCRLFKKKNGLTPTEYLMQNRIFKI